MTVYGQKSVGCKSIRQLARADHFLLRPSGPCSVTLVGTLLARVMTACVTQKRLPGLAPIILLKTGWGSKLQDLEGVHLT